MGAVASRIATVAALLALFAAMLAIHAALPAGAWRNGLIYALAALQVVLLALGFMRLAGSPVLVRLTAAATGVWLAILFGFTALDYLYR